MTAFKRLRRVGAINRAIPAFVGMAALIASIGLTGCSKDDPNPAGSELTPAQKVDRGWILFETGDYELALGEFEAAAGENAALADAWNGAGWSMGKLPGRIDEAPAKFQRAIEADTARYDAFGGWAFALYKQGDWPGALDKCDRLLNRRPGWKFLHEQTLDQNDLHLLRAASYYNLGDFESSYGVITGQLNTSFEADVRTASGRRELSEEIERLRRVYG